MISTHGRLARWIKWRACDVGEAKEGLENELWRRWSNGRVGEWAETYVKRGKGWRMSCDVGKATEGLENELWRGWSDEKGWRMSRAPSYSHNRAHSPTFPSLYLRHNSFSKLPSLYLRHSSFSNPSFASPTSQALHLIHLASRPWHNTRSNFKIRFKIIIKSVIY